MKVADYSLLSTGPTPKEVKRMRKEIYDYHYVLGRPVVFKHRWNLQDAQNGLCLTCPFLDETYHRDKTDCLYCFGTGFLGGFDDGVVVFVTIADAPVDQLRISEAGFVLYDRHPQMIAPWVPDMGDGDLIITADFDKSTWNVLQTHDVFELNNIEPVTVRGTWGQNVDYRLYKLQQKAKIDRIPDTHIFYTVPIDFDYSVIPTISPAIGTFPSDTRGLKASRQIPFRIIGQEGVSGSAISNTLKVRVYGEQSTITFPLKMRVHHKTSGVIFE